jgi:predicted O-methyltransferase YrrM
VEDNSRYRKYTLQDSDFEELLNVYGNLGYHRDLVTHWAIPKPDACKLLELIEIHEPKTILEVGTFVGFSTLLMAKYGPSVFHVHTVDPNFRLQVELGAMNTNAHDSNIEVRHQELALRAAQSLGLDSKITFHPGGYSTGSNYASAKSDPLCTVPVVGRQVGETYGPFDMIFIDGLHYEDAVLSDLRLAQEFLAQKGVIVLHDVIGGWGSNVRRAVFQFLTENQKFLFKHGKYSDLFDSIGFLQLEQNVKKDGSSSVALKYSENFFDQQEFVKNIVSILMRLCTPRSVIYFGDDRFGLLRCFADFGVTKLSHVGSQSIFVNSNSPDLIEFEAFDFDVVYEPADTFDLCITVGDVDEMDLRKAQNLIDSCMGSSETLFFVVTPPGESGASGPGSRPMRWWVAKFWEKGFRFHDVIRPSIEPLRFSYSYSPIYKVGSSKFSNIFLVKREESDNKKPEKLLEKVMGEKESRIEDLSLQAVYTDILLHDLLIKSKAAQDQSQKQSIALEKCFRKIEQLHDQKNDLARQLAYFQKLPKMVLRILMRVFEWISESPRILKALRYFSRK